MGGRGTVFFIANPFSEADPARFDVVIRSAGLHAHKLFYRREYRRRRNPGASGMFCYFVCFFARGGMRPTGDRMNNQGKAIRRSDGIPSHQARAGRCHARPAVCVDGHVADIAF